MNKLITDPPHLEDSTSTDPASLLSSTHHPHPAPQRETSPEIGSLDELSFLENWVQYRDQALTPHILSELVTTQQSRDEFILGCQLLGVDMPKPHQLVINDMLNAGHEENALLMPRQSAKTTTVAIVVVGRCASRPRFNVAWTLTTSAAKTGEVFEQTIQDTLELVYGDDDGHRPFRNYRGKGAQYVKFPNGSRITAKTPKGGSFRASSYDLVWIDEGGEATPEQGEDLTGAILSTFDTREGAQLIVSGTAGDYRRGQLLYEGLHNEEYGRLAYQIPEDTEPDVMAAWTPTEEHPFGNAEAMTLAMHPGIHSGLTTIDKVKRRFTASTPARYTREYCGIFGDIGDGVGPIDVTAWTEAGRNDTPDVPEHFTLVAATSFFGSYASLMAVWRDDDGMACGYLIDHREGSTWLADRAAVKSREHGHPVVFDRGSSTMRAEAELMAKFVPPVHMVERTFEHVPVAHALLTKEINAGRVIHWNQPPLDNAAKSAVRRPVGANSWAFGRGKNSSLDLSPLEAFALGIHYYDENPHYEGFAPITS